MRTSLPGASLALFALLAVAPVAAQAQSGSAAIEDSITIPSKTLANGLEIIVIEDHSLPLVTIELVARNGAYTEPPPYNGLSHLYEHMFFKGNAAIPSQEAYMARQRELGMVWNGTTSDERVNYFFTLGSEQLDPGMKFMADAIQTPLFKEEELVKERQVVIGELDRAESNPYYHLNKALTEKMFWKHPTRKDTIGDRETITTASREKMLTVQKKFYIPNNSALILAGDVTPDQAYQLAEQHFGAWKRGPNPFKVDPVPAHPPIKRTEAIIVNQKVQRASVMIGFHGPSVGKDPAATYAADVFSFIVAQPSSRFQKAMVESGLTLGAGVSYYTLNHTGPISVVLETTPDQLEKAIKAVQDEIRKFDDPDYFTDDQIETAKTLLAVSNLYDREKTSSFAHTVSFWWAVASLDYYLSYIENLKKVTRQDMARYVKSYILGKPYVMAIMVSPEAQKELKLTKASADKMAKVIR